MMRMQHLMKGLAGSLVAGMAILALLMSLLATGFPHAAAASCPATSGKLTLASSSGKASKFREVHEVKVGKAAASTSHGGPSPGGLKLKPVNCCDGICAPSLVASTSNAITLRGDAVIKGSAPRDSRRTAMARGLERPPRPSLA